ncbi:MAG: lysine--tRNA ligase [Candidatus Parcubacteria bacterium]|nr:MAG: lysine--tRNA ligase [Candidatus Parcubacteria bacterium]
MKVNTINLYPEKSKRDLTILDFIKKFKQFIKTKKNIWLVGRIMALRNHKNIIFADIQDETGKIQIIFKKDITQKFKLINDLFKIGDFINVYGEAFLPQTKELSLIAKKYTLLSKSIKNFPNEYYKIKDEELLVRCPYLKTIFYEEERNIFKSRFKIIQFLREILWQKGFIEVETPILQTHYGGALAKPFKTYLDALDLPLYLRIAPELYLKKMIVGGFEKIFEIGKNFRNEGIDREHNPEFTMMELYYAYCDRNGLMNFVEDLIKELVKKFNKYKNNKNNNLIINYQGNKINFAKKWRIYKYTEIIKKFTGLDYFKNNLSDFLRFADKNNIEYKPKIITKGKIIDEIFKKLIRKTLIQPTFLIDHPLEISPLAKLHPKNPKLTLRFQGYIGGLEIINAFSELNDPIDQKNRFIEEAKLIKKGDEEAHPYDETFIEALEYGMPPTAGLGIGIDRLVMILTDSKFLKEVIYFPFVREKL